MPHAVVADHVGWDEYAEEVPVQVIGYAGESAQAGQDPADAGDVACGLCMDQAVWPVSSSGVNISMMWPVRSLALSAW